MADKRIWKRIWWTLFTRDRCVAVALGSTLLMNADDCDVEMIREEDFIEDDDPNHEIGQDPLHVQFFLQYVKLCKIMGLILLQQYSVASKTRGESAIDLTHSIMALTDWLRDCPVEVYWELPRHKFWSAVLKLNYYTTMFFLRRIHMPPATGRDTGEDWCSSQNIDLQPAAMITSIANTLAAHNELRYCPAFIVYSLFSALVMHARQMQSTAASVVQAAQDGMKTCMNAVRGISRVWLVAKVVYTLFEPILSSTVIQERTKKTPGKRHKNMNRDVDREVSQNSLETSRKRKYGEMKFEFYVSNGPPSQELYEKSHPPVLTRDLSMATPPISASGTRQSQDILMTTTSYFLQRRAAILTSSVSSVPAVSLDLYTVMENTPRLSESAIQPQQPSPER